VDDAATAASLRRDEKRALAWYSEFQQAGRPRAGPRLSLRRSDAAALAPGEPLDSSGAPPSARPPPMCVPCDIGLLGVDLCLAQSVLEGTWGVEVCVQTNFSKA